MIRPPPTPNMNRHRTPTTAPRTRAWRARARPGCVHHYTPIHARPCHAIQSIAPSIQHPPSIGRSIDRPAPTCTQPHSTFIPIARRRPRAPAAAAQVATAEAARGAAAAVAAGDATSWRGGGGGQVLIVWMWDGAGRPGAWGWGWRGGEVGSGGRVRLDAGDA